MIPQSLTIPKGQFLRWRSFSKSSANRIWNRFKVSKGIGMSHRAYGLLFLRKLVNFAVASPYVEMEDTLWCKGTTFSTTIISEGVRLGNAPLSPPCFLTLFLKI
jgi:hypothetical protein